MALTQITNGMSGLNARNAINAVISSVDGLITPLIAYVESNGSDSTGEFGNPAKPFLTPSAAINAGYANGNGANFGLQLGVGTFYYNRVDNENSFPTRCKTVKGKGRGLTLFYLSMQGADSDSEVGGNGANITVELLDLEAEVTTVGGDHTGDSGFNGGDSGNVSITGNAKIKIFSYGGSGSGEGANSGSTGSVTLKGSLLCYLEIASLSPSLSGTILADGVDFTLYFFSGISSVTMGRCSYLSGTQIDTDKGGNAEY